MLGNYWIPDLEKESIHFFAELVFLTPATNTRLCAKWSNQVLVQLKYVSIVSVWKTRYSYNSWMPEKPYRLTSILSQVITSSFVKVENCIGTMNDDLLNHDLIKTLVEFGICIEHHFVFLIKVYFLKIDVHNSNYQVKNRNF